MTEYCRNCGHPKSLHFHPFESTVAPCLGEIDLIGPDDAQLCGCESFARESILARSKHFMGDWAGRVVKPHKEAALTEAASTESAIEARTEPFSLRAELVKLQTELERISLRDSNPILQVAAMKLGELLDRR
jgi:hypothetical protein